MVILNDVKNALGVDEYNYAFDEELLLHINSAAGELTQLGLEYFSELIDENTMWPTFPNLLILTMIRQFVVLKVKLVFDPTPSETIVKTFQSTIQTLEARLMHEQEVLDNV